MHDVIIIGAGPAGSTLALTAAQMGLGVALVDARNHEPTAARDTRNFAIVTGSWRLLGFVGLHDDLLANAQPLLRLSAEDGAPHLFGAPSALFSGVDLRTESEEPGDDGLGYMVEAEHLQTALDAAIAASPAITVHRPERFAEISSNNQSITAHLESGVSISGRLLVGCDGLNSPVRHAAAIGVEGRDYDKSVFAANVTLSQPHGGIARQLFTPEGPFATLPLTGNRANLAWYMKSGAAEALAECSSEEIEAELNARFASFAGDMSLAGPVSAYPLKLQLARSMTAHRIALVGDSARRINPLAGQGLNLGFKDVATLAEICADRVMMGLDPGDDMALETYAQARRFDANMTALAMDAIDRIFSNDNVILKPVRGIALGLADRLKPVRSALAQQASATQSHLPRVMQRPTT